MTQPPRHPWEHPWPPDTPPLDRGDRGHPQSFPTREPGIPRMPTEPGFAPVRIPPPKKSRTGLIISLFLAGVVLLAGGAATVAATTSTHTATGRPLSGNGSPATSTTDETTSSAEPTSTSSSPSSQADARAVTTLGDNPINLDASAGAVTVNCPLPAFELDPAVQDRFYQTLIPCLMHAWAPALQAAHLPAETPRVITVAQDTDTPCGMRRWNQTALYCPNDHTIYMTARYYAEIESRTDSGVYLGQFAHEFGHAIQGLAGINQAYGDAVTKAGPTSPAGLELTRRSELQATCFEGMSLAALQNGGVSNDYVFPALRDSAGRGDEHSEVPDHGRTVTNSKWVNQGFVKNRVAQCNTWLSPVEDVS